MNEIEQKLRSQLPPFIRDLVNLNDGIMLAGGSIRSHLFSQYVKDYDFFFRDNQSLGDFLSYCMVRNIKLIAQTQYTSTFLSESGLKIQAVYKKFYDSPETLMNDFDFYNICSVYNKADGLVSPVEFYNSNESLIVSVKCITKPIDSLKRLGAYMARGYNIDEAYDYILSLLSTKDKNILLGTSYYDEDSI
jgi:hypothetical protein